MAAHVLIGMFERLDKSRLGLGRVLGSLTDRLNGRTEIPKILGRRAGISGGGRTRRGFLGRSGLCVPVIDGNGNGIVDDNEIGDERVAWIRQIGNNNGLGRALTLDLDDNLWVGEYNTRQFHKMSSVDGSALGVVTTVSTSPYGAVVTSNGDLFNANLGGGWVSRFSTADPAQNRGNASAGYYGIAVGRDHNGAERVATADYGRGFDLVNPTTMAVTNPLPYGYYPYGLSFDQAGNIVLGSGAGRFASGVTKARTDGSVLGESVVGDDLTASRRRRACVCRVFL